MFIRFVVFLTCPFGSWSSITSLFLFCLFKSLVFYYTLFRKPNSRVQRRSEYYLDSRFLCSDFISFTSLGSETQNQLVICILRSLSGLSTLFVCAEKGEKTTS